MVLLKDFQNVTITTNSNAQGGSDEQTKESVRFSALQYTAQNRAVTTTDYETKVIELYPNSQSVVAWGVKMMKHRFMVQLK